MKARRASLFAAFALVVAQPAVGQRPPATETVWPLPPEAPRIRFAGQLTSERDIGIKPSFFARLKGALLGGSQANTWIQRPHDVYSQDGKRFYVSDGAAGKVLVFDAGTRAVSMLGESGAGALRKPMGLGGDGRGNVYVADPSAKRVAAFDAAGQFVRAYGGQAVLHNPVDVAVDATAGRVYVADSYLHQVVVFNERTGDVVQRIGRDQGDLVAKRARLHGQWDGSIRGQADPAKQVADQSEVPGHDDGFVNETRDLVENRGSTAGEFRYPAFLAVAPDGTLYVSDGMNFRIQAFDRQGRYLREFGRLGDVPGTFARPKGIGVDSHGNVYVADAAFSNLQIFGATGELLLALGALGRGEGFFWMPLGVHVDTQDRVYVADRFNNRIQVFEYLVDGTVAEPAAPRPRRNRR